MRVLIVGFGVEGKILTDYFLQTAEVTVADRKNLNEFDEKVIEEYSKKGVVWKTGDNYLEGLGQFDLIAHSPAITSEVREKIYSCGVKTTTQTQIFLDKVGSKNIVGVTGTNGKGTTCSLIAEMLEESGKKVFLVGNIGEGMINHLEEIQVNDWVVMELSSYQLRDVQKSPHIAVVLNITPDHMNMHTDMKEYIESKVNIVRFQTPKDVAVINSDYEVTKKLAERTTAKIVWFGRDDVRDKYEVKIPGEHNFENAAAAIKVAQLANVDDEVIRKVLMTFGGLEHRLQLVADKNGVKYIDDSISTNPATAIAAIRSFTEPKILILGGSSKKADFEELAKTITLDVSVKAVVLTGQTSDEIDRCLKEAGYSRQKSYAKGMKNVVNKAVKSSKPGDVVLLSPACASFGEYVDYKDRGKQFTQIVQGLG